MDIGFSIHQRDESGDIYDEGIFLWFDDKVCLRVGSMDDLNKLLGDIKRCKDEILERYGYIK